MISIKDRFGVGWPIFGGPFVSTAADHNWPNLYQASLPPGGLLSIWHTKRTTHSASIGYPQADRHSGSCHGLWTKVWINIFFVWNVKSRQKWSGQCPNERGSLAMWTAARLFNQILVAISIQLRPVTTNLSTFYTHASIFAFCFKGQQGGWTSTFEQFSTSAIWGGWKIIQKQCWGWQRSIVVQLLCATFISEAAAPTIQVRQEFQRSLQCFCQSVEAG